MKLGSNSAWSEEQIVAFLESSKIPVRLSFINEKNHPQICSLWYQFVDGVLWAASHKNAYLIKQLKQNPNVAFEISSNDYPYKGVKGTATVELITANAGDVLENLISRYLGDSNSGLSEWLMSRVADEYAIKIVPKRVNSWDFSSRMQR